MTKLHYIFLAIMGTAAAAVSCAEIPAPDEASEDRRIRFTTAAYVPQTKAETFSDNEFQVSAWTATGSQLYFKNATVTKSDGIWSTSDAYYWPKTDNLYFVATHGKISDSPWISINDAGNTLTTSGEITVKPVLTSNAGSRLLFSDKTLGSRTAASVPITFRNALAAVTASVRIRKCDDAAVLDGDYYRTYEVWDESDYTKGTGESDADFNARVEADLATKTTYCVIPFGFSPNGALSIDPTHTKVYPTQVKLKTPIHHIWNATILYIGAENVATKGSLEMSLNSDNSWKADSVWTITADSEHHADTVYLYSYEKDGESTGTLIPANLQDYACNFASGYAVIPQKLNWSPSSSINNQKARVKVQIQDYTADFNGDGIFDYRDVYQYWVINKTNPKDSVLINNASALSGHKEDDGYTFYRWYEWDGSATGKYKKLKALHDLVGTYYPGKTLTYGKPLEGTTTYLDYEVKSTIDLDQIPTAPKCWGMNTMTTYNISIDPMTDRIAVAPTVTSWVDLGSISTE